MDYSDYFSPKLNENATLSTVLNLFECPYDIHGSRNEKILGGTRPVSNAGSGDIAFIDQNRKDIAESIEEVKAGLLFCTKQIYGIIKNKLADYVLIITVSEPKMIYTQVIASLTQEKTNPGIHETVIIGDECKIHPTSVIGPFCVIGDNVTIGEDTIISSHCFIGKNVYIGNKVIISSGARIANDGFGFIKKEDGSSVNFPHIGGVVIEDDVRIGANNCIDRGGLGNTLLKQGCKLDNMVHVAHNVVIGKNTFVTACVMIAGSTEIGDNVYIAPSASLTDVIKVEENSFIGIGAVLIKNVPSGEVWAGNPARYLRKNHT